MQSWEGTSLKDANAGCGWGLLTCDVTHLTSPECAAEAPAISEGELGSCRYSSRCDKTAELFSTSETTRLLGASRSTVVLMCQRGSLPALPS